MTNREKKTVIHRLLSGCTRCRVNNTVYIVKSPTPDILCIADEIYEETLRSCQFKEWISNDRLDKLLVHLKLWEPDGDSKYKELEKTIDDLKVRLYQSVLSAPAEHDQIRVTLDKCKARQQSLYSTRHCLDRLTYTGYSEIVSQRFIYGRSVHTEEGALMWSRVEDINGKLLDEIIVSHKAKELDVAKYREIARSEPWRSMWAIHKQSLVADINISEGTRTLMLFSRMYDNAFESPDCPKDDIVNDDDMFDGWLILQRREREKSQMDRQLERQKERVFGSDKRTENASEFFLPAQSLDEAKRVQQHNDLEATMIRKQRDKAIHDAKGKDVADLELPDVRRDITMQANKQFVETVKGKH